MGNKAPKRKSSTSKKAAKEETEEVDYGATADEMFDKFQDEEEQGDEKVDWKEPSSDASSKEESDNSDGDDDEKEESKEAGRQMKDTEDSDDNSISDDDVEEDSDDDDDADELELANRAAASAGNGPEGCSFDLRNLTAVNSHPLQETQLFKKKGKKEEGALTIGTSNALNDEYLLQKATEGATQLIEALWQLPTQRSDAGPLMTLPTYNALEIPRALPPPPPKAETRWEKFAKERGLPLNKEKRSRKVWDEASKSWKFRHGYEKANSAEGDGGGSSHKWPIMEVGANDDPYADPWEKERDAKYKKTEKNRENQLKNQERSGMVAKGTTTRIIKSRDAARKVGKEGGRQDNQLPAGVPVDMTKKTLRGKPSLSAALKATQASTASLGRFDKMREGEPERKFPQSKKKRKLTVAAVDTVGPRVGEQERGMKVLNKVLNGGGVAKEKARKKGKLAKGVTAYDYDYDDGSNNAIFNKKKGRGGIGKNKKMTKKRIK